LGRSRLKVTILPSQPPGPVRRTPNSSAQYVVIAIVVVVALVAAYLEFGRGGHPSSTSPAVPVASPIVATAPPAPKMAASKLINLAERTVKRAKWGRITFTITSSNGNVETEDVRGGPHVQSEINTFDGHIARVIIVRKTAYISADSLYLNQLEGFPSAVADLASGWVRLVPGDPHYATVTQNTGGSNRLFPLIKPKVVGVVERSGVDSVELDGTLGKRNPRQGTLYLAAVKPYRPIEFDEVGAVHGVSITVALRFGDFGQRVRIVAPRHSTSYQALLAETRA
jgi:hypothetical protein